LSRRKAISEGHLYKGAAFVYDAVALPTNSDTRAQDFDAAEKAGCSIGGGSTAVVSISSP
jgi:hypothetical protein